MSASRLLLLQERRSSRGGSLRSDDPRLAKNLIEQSSDDVTSKLARLPADCPPTRRFERYSLSAEPQGLARTVQYTDDCAIIRSIAGGGKKPPQDQKGVQEIADVRIKIYRLV